MNIIKWSEYSHVNEIRPNKYKPAPHRFCKIHNIFVVTCDVTCAVCLAQKQCTMGYTHAAVFASGLSECTCTDSLMNTGRKSET